MTVHKLFEGVEPITLQQRVHGASRPASWALNKLHRVLRVRRGQKNAGMAEDNLLSLSYGRIIPKDINTSEGLLPESFEGYQIVERGNIVMRLTDLQNDKRSLRQGLVKERGIITSAYDALEVSKEHCPEFWFYSLLALDLAKHYYSLGGGVRQSVKFSDFPNDWIYLPDLTTQRQIADFLDRETARIDLLIEKKQRMVALTDERLTSSLELAMEANGHEQRLPLRRVLTKIEQGWSPDCETRTKEEAEWGVLKVGCVNGMTFDPSEHKTLPASLSPVETLEIKVGDILMSRANSPELVGSVAIVSGDVDRLMLCDKLYRLRFRSEMMLPEFAVLALRSKSARFHYWSRSNGASSSMQNISQETVRTLVVPVPSIEQQQRIIKQLVEEQDKLAATMVVTQTSITRLREYRSALITAAVTGQIDPATYAGEAPTDAAHATGAP